MPNKTALFASDLVRWYLKYRRDLPWRRTRDPYKIWVSEIMLQQTTVGTVIDYYHRWMEKFATLEALASASLPMVLKQWQGLGYYNRAKNMHKAARILVDDHAGQIPREALLVRALPGFGPYTTGAVLSIAYDMPLTLIDANVRRVVMRLLALQGVADTKQDSKIDAFLHQVLPVKGARDFNQALMELGALICRAKSPSCLACPVSRYCQAYAQGQQGMIPEIKKRLFENIQAVIAIIKKKDAYYMQQRPSTGLLADLWEFPGGKIKSRESKERALRRELEEELGCGLKTAKYLFEVKHSYTQFRVRLSVFACTLDKGPKIDATHRWIQVKDFDQYPMPSGSTKIIRKLLSVTF